MAKTDCSVPVLKRAFLFCYLTGLRFSDCEELKWSEVQVSDATGWILRYRQKKTKESETTPLSESAVKLLGEKPEDQTQKVFQGLKYTQYKKLEVWFTKAGVSKKVHFHISRHSHACLLLQKNEMALKFVLNWNSSKTLQSKYNLLSFQEYNHKNTAASMLCKRTIEGYVNAPPICRLCFIFLLLYNSSSFKTMGSLPLSSPICIDPKNYNKVTKNFIFSGTSQELWYFLGNNYKYQ
ncbi:MAG: tyrosine-type recombinase/integrase [Sporocytophaga sp.]|nr:tyrosine-type recombinase/integrase [Sporocytophaga sp.]